VYGSPTVRHEARLAASTFRVLDASVGRKLFVELRLKIPHRFLYCFTSGQTKRAEHPSAFIATPPRDSQSFGPYQFAGRSFLGLMIHRASQGGHDNCTLTKRAGNSV
jgi:hypothetical protein